MALVNCPECGKSVSTSASACPNCGNPIASALETMAVGTQLTTVQETSKRLKLHSLGSLFLLIVGIIWLIVAIKTATEGGSDNLQTTIPAIMFWVGLVWYIVTRFRIWWHHK